MEQAEERRWLVLADLVEVFALRLAVVLRGNDTGEGDTRFRERIVDLLLGLVLLRVANRPLAEDDLFLQFYVQIERARLMFLDPFQSTGNVPGQIAVIIVHVNARSNCALLA